MRVVQGVVGTDAAILGPLRRAIPDIDSKHAAYGQLNVNKAQQRAFLGEILEERKAIERGVLRGDAASVEKAKALKELGLLSDQKLTRLVLKSRAGKRAILAVPGGAEHGAKFVKMMFVLLVIVVFIALIAGFLGL
ncbi:hypothetical protein HYS54_00805 [Candidatus Micrarchaeota archaeon]|nr:hypothetical protein [Candidatus Micrarchaeota archaeon]